jgi:hypothetical protein
MRRLVVFFACLLLTGAFLSQRVSARVGAVADRVASSEPVRRVLIAGRGKVTSTTVDSTAKLMGALRVARGGDTIFLAPGIYSGFTSKGANFAFDSPVTVASADPNHQAVFTDFHVTNLKGFTFRNLEFHALTGGFAFEIRGATDVHFDRVHFHGSLDDDSSNDPSGLGFAKGSNISVRNSEFQQLTKAVAISLSDGVVISGNYMHDLRSDGVNMAQVSNVKITENLFRNFRPLSTDHPDAIQMWTTNTTAGSHDILIENNAILRGEGAYTEGVLLGDNAKLAYERVTISNNLIVGTGYNGLRLVNVNGLMLEGNQLVTLAGQNYTNILIQRSDDITSRGNRTSRAIGYDKSTNVSASDNTVTKDVTDLGAAAIHNWAEQHPNVAVVSKLLPTLLSGGPAS